MKVLYIINGLGAGGAEQSLAEMLPLLQDRGVAVTVACLYRTQEGLSSQVVEAGFDVRFLKAGNAAARVRAVRRLIRAEQPRLVHTTLLEASLVGRLAAARTGVPVLTSLVSTSYVPARFRDPNITAWKLRLVQQADKWTARYLTDHFHAITDAVKQAGVYDLGLTPDRITVVPRGRDWERMGKPNVDRRRRVRGNLGLSEEIEVIANVGRQEYPKGQQHLLKAFEQIAVKHPRAVLLIAGRKGHASPELHRQMGGSAILRERVRFLGHRDDVPDLLAASDVFVFPSLYEGLGGAVIEAMALRLPIVASDVPAVREVTEEGENAVLVPPGDSKALARALSELLVDHDRRERYGKRSRAIYEERFTLDNVVDRMAALYRTVARN